MNWTLNDLNAIYSLNYKTTLNCTMTIFYVCVFPIQVVLVISIGIVGYFLDKTDAVIESILSNKKKGNLQFFIAVVVVACIVVVALFSLFITGLHEKVTQINWPLTVCTNFISVISPYRNRQRTKPKSLFLLLYTNQSLQNSLPGIVLYKPRVTPSAYKTANRHQCLH